MEFCLFALLPTLNFATGTMCMSEVDTQATGIALAIPNSILHHAWKVLCLYNNAAWEGGSRKTGGK